MSDSLPLVSNARNSTYFHCYLSSQTRSPIWPRILRLVCQLPMPLGIHLILSYHFLPNNHQFYMMWHICYYIQNWMVSCVNTSNSSRHSTCSATALPDILLLRSIVVIRYWKHLSRLLDSQNISFHTQTCTLIKMLMAGMKVIIVYVFTMEKGLEGDNDYVDIHPAMKWYNLQRP